MTGSKEDLLESQAQSACPAYTQIAGTLCHHIRHTGVQLCAHPDISQLHSSTAAVTSRRVAAAADPRHCLSQCQIHHPADSKQSNFLRIFSNHYFFVTLVVWKECEA